MNRAILLLPILLATPALAQQAPPPPPPFQPAPTPAERVRASGGSLFRAGQAARPAVAQASLFAVAPPEPRVLKKHDLITVIVREESNYKSEGAYDAKRETSLQAKLNEFVEFDLSNGTVSGIGAGTSPGIDFTAEREAQNDASVDRKDSLIYRITAEVLDVKPNGTVVVQARKRIKTDDEEQTMLLSGTCRAEDVTGDNTILSNQLHDLDVTKSHKGGVRDGTRRGWFTKLLDGANPF